MYEHHTKFQGDVALHRVMCAFIERGWAVALPTSEHLCYDMVATRQASHTSKVICRTVQVKGMFTEKPGVVKLSRMQHYEGLDYVAYYVASIDEVLFIRTDWLSKIKTIRFSVPNAVSTSDGLFWFEDFLKIRSDIPPKRTLKQLGFNVLFGAIS